MIFIDDKREEMQNVARDIVNRKSQENAKAK